MDDNKHSSGPWNERMLLQLKRVAEASQGYKWMHDHEYIYYLSLDGKYTKIEILLISIISCLMSSQFIGIITNTGLNDNTKAMTILTAVQLFFVGIYGIVKAFRESKGIPERILNHNLSSLRFGEIYVAIQEQFVLDVNRRESDKEFYKAVSKNYNTLIFDSPDIRNKTMREYTKEIKDKNIYKPITLGGIDEVNAFIDDKSKDFTEISSTNDALYNYEIDKWLTAGTIV